MSKENPEEESKEPKTRMGDTTEQSVALCKKYEQLKSVVQSLPGIDLSLHEQQDRIEQAKQKLQKKTELIQKYHESLFQGNVDMDTNDIVIDNDQAQG